MLLLVLATLGGCSEPAEPEVYTTSVNVDETSVEAVLAALDALTENDIDEAALLELTRSTGMDEEKQQRFDVNFAGTNTTVLYHVWREQEDWVHLYASSDSKPLVDAITAAFAPFSRDEE